MHYRGEAHDGLAEKTRKRKKEFCRRSGYPGEEERFPDVSDSLIA